MGKSLLADIDAAAAAASVTRTIWFDRLPPDAVETLNAAREKFMAGGYGQLKAQPLARILLEHAAKRGWVLCDIKRLAEWLRGR